MTGTGGKVIYQYTLKREKVNGIADNILTSNPVDVVEFLRSIHLHEEEQECLISVVLDARNNIRGYYEVTRGLVDQTLAHSREFFRHSIVSNASGIVMAHNHPSGSIDPSAKDIQLTQNMKKSGEILGIPLMDHIILGDNNYYSFAEEGML